MQGAPHPHQGCGGGNTETLLCSINCSEKQVNALFVGRTEEKPVAGEGLMVTRKRAGGRSGSGGGVSPCGQLPSFEEDEEESGRGRNLSISDPIPIKKVAIEPLNETSTSEQGKPCQSRSFEESRPRSLEMDMSIGAAGEKDSPLSKGRHQAV